MDRKPINQVVAEALRFFMEQGRWSQLALGRAASVAPGTVKNCMFPELRERAASGKEPSVKVTELSLIADALGVHIADLVTDATPEERGRIFRRRAADFYAEHGRWPDWAPSPSDSASKVQDQAA